MQSWTVLAELRIHGICTCIFLVAAATQAVLLMCYTSFSSPPSSLAYCTMQDPPHPVVSKLAKIRISYLWT